MGLICLLSGQLNRAGHPDIQLRKHDSENIRVSTGYGVTKSRIIMSSRPVEHGFREILVVICQWILLLVAGRQCCSAGISAVVAQSWLLILSLSLTPLVNKLNRTENKEYIH